MQDEPVRRRRRVRHGPAEPPAEPAPPVARPSAAPAGRGPTGGGGSSGAGPAGGAGPASGAGGGPTASAGGNPGPGRPPVHRRGEETDAVDAADSSGERGLRGLIGGGSSQVSPGAALRARDASRPGADDLARAEAELTIVRRHWTPPTPAT